MSTNMLTNKLKKMEESALHNLVSNNIALFRDLTSRHINEIMRNETQDYPAVYNLLLQNAGLFPNLLNIEKSGIILNAINLWENLQYAPNVNKDTQPMEVDLEEQPHPTLPDMIDCLPQNVKERLKDHQNEGIGFLYKRIIDEESGAILAHNMGLGKTLTTLSFVYAILTLRKSLIPKVIIVVPVNVLYQWQSEYGKWFGDTSCITIMDDKRETRIQNVVSWSLNNEKSIMIIGYPKFVDVMDNITGRRAVNSVKLIVFDEAHKLKTEKTNVYKTAEKIETRLKIFLSGTPLQNNVMEYFNMIHLISPDLLGTREIFKKDFLEPIENGKAKDSPQPDIDRRKSLCRDIFNRAADIVHRKSAKVLFDAIDIEKHETSLLLNPTEAQRNLMTDYLSDGVKVAIVDKNCVTYILNHPSIYMRMRDVPVPEEILLDFQLSNKIILLLKLIKHCDDICDKLLIFTSSIATLDYIEIVLLETRNSWITEGLEAGENIAHQQTWERSYDYDRIDGTTKQIRRLEIQNNFKDNDRLRLMLFSTVAGSLGTNFDSANRVVLFDACWNPSHDIQSLFRVCRLGQEKTVFVYRFITEATMESAVYKRQISKEATQFRVLENENIVNSFTKEELKNLYPTTTVEQLTNKDPENLSIIDPFLPIIMEAHANSVYQIISHQSYFGEEEEFEDALSDESDFLISDSEDVTESLQ